MTHNETLVMNGMAKNLKKVAENTDCIIQLVDTVAKTMIEAFENIKIEDVNMFRLGYSKAENDYHAQSEKDRQSSYDCGYDVGYSKALDDFVKEICKMIVQSEKNGNYRFYAVEIKQAIVDLAEQLKEQKNGQSVISANMKLRYVPRYDG